MKKTLTKDNLVAGALGVYPHGLREDILEDDDFRAKNEIKADSVLTLEPGAVRVRRSLLFSALRKLLGEPGVHPDGIKIGNTDVSVHLIGDADGPRRLGIAKGDHRFVLPDLAALTPDIAERLAWLEKEAAEVGLDDESLEGWRSKFSAESVSDEDAAAVLRDLAMTPKGISDAIASELQKGSVKIESIAPSDRRYYDRLLGRYDGSTSLSDVAANVVAPQVRRLLKNDTLEGLKAALLLSGHSYFTDEIARNNLSFSTLKQLFAWLEARGDVLSQIGGIELGFKFCETFPDIEPMLVRLIGRVLGYDDDAEAGELKLCSALFMLIDAEFSKKRLFDDAPPFWRRHAALSQAALVARQINEHQTPYQVFTEWGQSRGTAFYIQTLVDLRREPRWLPDYVTPDQQKIEAIARIIGGAHRVRDKISSDDLRKLIFDEKSGVLAEFNPLLSSLPGPLEGGTQPLSNMPEEVENHLREKLAEETLTAKSFVSLVNAALIFKVGPAIVELAAEALRRIRYQLNDQEAPDAIANLIGLANVAAVTRSSALAQEVRVLARVTRRKFRKEFSADLALRLGLIAAAANAELQDWSMAVGSWVAEIAFGDVEKIEVEQLQSRLHEILRVEPGLWTTCSKSEAAIRSLVT